jgi:four helix bundle protein
MGTVQSYQDLVAWQKSMELAEAVYECARKLPREETYGLAAQMRGASVSIAANIAEGHGRNSIGEYRQFLGIARGSLAELETEVTLAARVRLIDDKTCSRLLDMCGQTSKVLRGLQKALADK